MGWETLIILGCAFFIAFVIQVISVLWHRWGVVTVTHGGIKVVIQKGVCGCGNRMDDIRLIPETGEVKATCHRCCSERLVARLMRKDG